MSAEATSLSWPDLLRQLIFHIIVEKYKKDKERFVKSVISLLLPAYTGDVSALRRFALSSMDMEQRDYDCRTALHVAAAEGHTEVVRFLLEGCRVNPEPRDRWGNTPMDEAAHFGHRDVVTVLQQCRDACGAPAAEGRRGPPLRRAWARSSDGGPEVTCFQNDIDLLVAAAAG